MSNYTAICIVCKESRVLKHKPKSSESGKCKKCWMLEKNTKHGESKTRLYGIWSDMKKRCDNENHVMYRYYGGEGVSYAEEWKAFVPFRDWANVNGYADDLEIDRVDGAKIYSPSTCRWATRTVQMQNTRRIYSHNKSGYRGVSLKKARNSNCRDRWYAQISVDGKKRFIGYYDTKVDAARAYDQYVVDNGLKHTTNKGFYDD